MHQYKTLLKEVLLKGSWQSNRTGERALSMPGGFMQFDLEEGFPAATLKKLPFKSVFGEFVALLRPFNNARDFRALGCKVWDQNANENKEWLNNPHRLGEDDLGEIYGIQWRRWPGLRFAPFNRTAEIQVALSLGFTPCAQGQINGIEGLILFKEIDQVAEALHKIHTNPTDRRILFHAWNPVLLDQMALPPCHLLYQFHVAEAKTEISLNLYLRSNDLGLGAPFNIAEGAAMLSLFGRLTGYKPKWLTYFIGDAHIYENHMPMVEEILTREPLELPTLKISDRIPDYAQTGRFEPEWLNKIEPDDFELVNYRHHGIIKAPMAI